LNPNDFMKLIVFFYFLFSISFVQANKDFSGCGTDEKSRELAKLIIEYFEQRREFLVCNEKLSVVAMKKAELMADANLVAHTLNNITPNELLTKEGIKLPYSYSILGNQVESLQGGAETAQKAFENFLASLPHKNHLLGENQFFLNQDQIGVGYFFNQSTYHEDYWVVYITSLEDKNDEKGMGFKIVPGNITLPDAEDMRKIRIQKNMDAHINKDSKIKPKYQDK